VHVVAGNCDEADKDSLQMTFPESKVISIGEFRLVDWTRSILTWKKYSIAYWSLYSFNIYCQLKFCRIGVVHGHQILPWGNHSSLSMMRRRLDVDVLISGHTHKNEVVEHDGHYHINPGSITGAFSECRPGNVSPSFVLLAIQGKKVVCYVYELIDDEVEVFKTEFSK